MCTKCYTRKRIARRNVRLSRWRKIEVEFVQPTVPRSHLHVGSPLVVYIAGLFTPLLGRCRM